MHPPTLQDVRFLVAAACCAPSLQNAQPWHFRYVRAERALEVRGDGTRSLPCADPEGRALHVGCGAALLHLRAAAERVGRRAAVAVLPDPCDPALLATVRLGGAAPAARDPGLGRLFPPPHRRLGHPVRAGAQLTDTVCARLRAAARQEGADLVFPGWWHLDSVLALIAEAEEMERHDPGAWAERAAWDRRAAACRWDGRGTGLGGSLATFAGAGFVDRPQLALLGTCQDSRRDWLVAGQALGRVLLVGAAQGVAAALTSQGLERPDLRWALRDPLSSTGHVQVVLHLRRGADAPVRQRPLREVLSVA